MKKNMAGQKVAVFAWDKANNCAKTGDAANITAEISLDGGASAAVTDTNPTELDATDHPGIYLFDLSQAETNADLVVITAVSSSDDVHLDPVIIYPDDNHLLKAIFANAAVHTVATGVDKYMDDDGITELLTRTPAEEVSVTGANWTNSTKLLTQTDAFATYVHHTGDVIDLTGGTGVVAGEYTISAKIDDDTIELATDINEASGDISDSSVVGSINNGRIMVTPS